MTLNLLIVLGVVGIVIFGVARWLMRRSRDDNKSNGATNRNRNRSHGDAEQAPALGEFDLFSSQDEIPLLEVEAPDNPGEKKPYSGGDVASAETQMREQAVAEARVVHDFTADAVPETQTQTPHLSGKPRAPFRARDIDGFERLGQIDYWAKITGARDVGRETVLAIYRESAAELTRQHSIHGLKLPEKIWCNPEDESEDSRFADVVVSVQLADQSGAIDEDEMNRFSTLVSKLSEGTRREFVFMTTTDNALAQGRAIADFIRHFDSVFVVNISPPDGERFQGAAIDRYALQMGLERDGNHYYSRFKSVGGDKVPLYSLADLSDTGRFDFTNIKVFEARGLVFFTKPAVNRLPGAVFAEMVDTAKAFASRMRGEVNSPNHGSGVLSQEEVEALRGDIEQVAAEMEQLGLPAGSDEATRLF